MSMPGRYHYLDVVRATLMLLGLPYHVARIYSAGAPNFLNAEVTSPLLTLMSDTLHSFRMEAFFSIAGFFSYLILVRGPTGNWLVERMQRVGLPLLVCTLALAPIMTMAVVLGEARLASAPVPDLFAATAERLSAGPGGWVYHLWFLHCLLMLSFLLGGLRGLAARGPVARLRPVADWLTRWICRQPGWLGGLALSLGSFAFALAMLVLQGPLGINLSPFGAMFRLTNVLQFLPFFLIGAVMCRHRPLLEWLTRPDAATPILAIASAVLFATVSLDITPVADPRMQRLLVAALACLAGVFWLRLLLGFSSRHLAGPNRGFAYFAAASYTIYLVHLPIALWIGALLIGSGLSAGAAFVLNLLVTLALSIALHELIRRSPLLTYLLNGKRPKAVAVVA